MSAALLVSYPATAGARFDRDYYIATHLPLVRDQWGPHGLIDAIGFWPDGDASAPVAVALLAFQDAAARDAALASAEAATVFGDLPNFTDIEPSAQRLTLA